MFFKKSFSKVLTDFQNNPENKDFAIPGGSVDNFGRRHEKSFGAFSICALCSGQSFTLVLK